MSMSWKGPFLGAYLVAFIAIAAAALPVLGRLWRVHTMPISLKEKSPDALRVGMMGASFIGQNALIFAAGKRREVAVVAVAARETKRAESYARKNGIPVALGGESAYSDLLKRDDVEAVYISVPTRLHFYWAAEALKKGKHVLLEKPMTMNEDEAVELRKLASNSSVVLMEAAHYRHHPAAHRVRELITDGTLGPLQSVEARFSMIDPGAWLLDSGLFSGREAPAFVRANERVKNLDRWWYCVDEILWMTNASTAEVITVDERRFSLRASVRVTTGGVSPIQVSAKVDMARDTIFSPFDWRFTVVGTKGQVTYHNVGFPFAWHRIDIKDEHASRSEKYYGLGETTFEFQLRRFLVAVRSEDGWVSDDYHGPSTMSIVDAVHSMTPEGPLEKSTINPE